MNKITHIDPEETIRKLKARVARLEKALAAQPAPVQPPGAMETVYETIIHWDEGGGRRSRRELARRIVDLYTTPPAAQPAPVPLTDEMRKQMKERCDSMEMRGAFADGWLSAESAHGITKGQP